jgi:hypothetical protein
MMKHDFCSDEYLREAERILAGLAAEYAEVLGAETFSSCVVCFNAPANARPSPDGAAAWTMTVSAGGSAVLRGRRDDVDSLVLADYASSLPRARRILNDDAGGGPPPDEEQGVRRTGDLSKISPAMRTLLRSFHNELAKITA